MAEKNRFEESFDGELAEGWTWMWEVAEAWRVEDGVLHVRALPGTLWGDQDNAHNILIRSETPVVAGLTSQVSVVNQPTLQGEQAGLIWFIDESNYIKLIKECLEGTEWIVLAREENGKASLVNKIPIETASVRLRLSFAGGRMTGERMAANEKTWQIVGECAPLADTALHLGIYTHGGPEEEEHWAELSQFCSYVSEA